MEFRLVYWGELLRAAGRSSRVWEKRQIRIYLHDQLKRLWETHPVLKFYIEKCHATEGGIAISFVQHHMTQIEAIAKKWEGFVPVVNGDFGMLCEIDVLFLSAAGKAMKRDSGGGDIDNRMKTLLDALGVPQRGELGQELGQKEGEPPYPDPTFVLFSDDSLVTSIKVTADTLLTSASTADPSEACVIINVNAKTVNPMLSPYGVNV